MTTLTNIILPIPEEVEQALVDLTDLVIDAMIADIADNE